MKEIESLIRDAATKIAKEAVTRAFAVAMKSLDAPMVAEETKPRPVKAKQYANHRAHVIALRKEHPEWSDATIAKIVGIKTSYVSVIQSAARKDGELPPSKHHAARKTTPRKKKNAGLAGLITKTAADRDAIDDAIRAGKTDSEISRAFGVYHGSIGFRRKTLTKRDSTETLIVPAPAPSNGVHVDAAPSVVPVVAPQPQVTEAA